jgi:hypothetical protein
MKVLCQWQNKETLRWQRNTLNLCWGQMVDDDWDVLRMAMRGAHMCDMEGPVVGHHNKEQALDKA